MKNSAARIFRNISMHNGDPEPCWEWLHDTKGGGSDNRPYFSVNGRKRLAYRVVWELVKGEHLASSVILRHSCDNPRCCNPHHLEKGTHQENMDDMKQRNRHGLSAYVVKNIRTLLDQGKTQQIIADLYGVSREAVSAIATGRTHGHVEGDTDE